MDKDFNNDDDDDETLFTIELENEDNYINNTRLLDNINESKIDSYYINNNNFPVNQIN